MNAQAKASRTPAAEVRRGRVPLAPIDRRIQSSPLPVTPTARPEVFWGQRTKDHGKSIVKLCDVTLARSSCPPDARRVAESIRAIITKSTGGIFFPFRGDVGPVFKDLAISDDMTTADDLIDQFKGLFVDSLRTVPRARMAEIREHIESDGGKRSPDEPRKPFSLPETLDELQFENRQVHMTANTLANIASFLAVDPDARQRQTSVTLKFIGALLEELAPHRVKNPINSCILCHRHDFDRQICQHHVEDNRYTSSTVQRARFQKAQEVNNRKFEAKVKGKRGLFVALLEKERANELMLADIQAGFDACFPGSAIANTKTIWEESVADYMTRCNQSGMKTEPVNVNALAWCWYAHPSIEDPKGFERLDQPLSSVLLKLFNDVHRFECFVDGGGEIVRQRRKSITSAKDIRSIGVMRQSDGLSMRAIGDAMGISTSQVKRILLELGLD